MPSIRHDLPSGGWVEVRDHTLLRAKARKGLVQALSPRIDGKAPMEAGFLTIDAVAALMITGWELPYQPEDSDDGTPRAWALPSEDVTMLDELTAEDSAAVQQIIDPARMALFPQRATPDQVNDKQSPSGPASE